MTALAGLVHGGGRDAPADCRRMLGAQAIYGRHDGIWSDGAIAIGRRLFPLLPEDAHDRGPTIGGDGHLALVADIRIDNRPELAAELGVPAGALAGLSDAALLMRALERWDEEAIAKIVGDFALAFWNARRRQLLLARDFAGQRPLHYHRGKGFFAFASMPKGLHALADIPYALDAEQVRDALAMLPEAGSGTFFEGIERVEPGHAVAFSDDKLTIRKFWRPALNPVILDSAGAYEEALRHHFDTAVSARLRGVEHAVAAHLSAGLDSSTVAATAARLLRPSGGKVVAFTSVPRPDYRGPTMRNAINDEGPLAAATAAMHDNIEHVPIVTAGRSPFDGLDRNFLLYERPGGNLCNMVWSDAINDAARARGLRVLLSGQMGNATFSYAGMELLPMLLSRGKLIRLGRTVAALLKNGTRATTIAAKTIGPILPKGIWSALGRLRGVGGDAGDYSAVKADAAERDRIARRAAAHDPAFGHRPRTDAVAARLSVIDRIDPGNFIKGVLGGWGIDTRDPTADRRLVEFCLSVPLDQFLRNGVPRALARDAFGDRVPQTVLRQRRKGYQGVDWHEGLSASRGQLRDELARMASCHSVAKALDLDRFAALVDAWPADGWGEAETVEKYRLMLLRGVSNGHFIRKVTGAN